LRRWLLAISGLSVLILAVAWMWGAFHPKVQPGQVPFSGVPAAGRELAKVEMLPVEETIEATGTVQPRYLTKVESQVLASIVAVVASPGDRVQPGQLLVTLDDREIQAQLRAARAALDAANADLKVRQDEYARYKQMYGDNAVTKEQYEQVQGAYLVAKAQVQRASEQATRTEVMLSYTRIAASRGGIVLDRYVDPGDLAAPGKTLLSLHDPKDLELHAGVREELAQNVRPGMTLPVEIEAAGLRADGKVREIVPLASVASRSVLVKVSLPPYQADRLYAGMFGRLLIPLGRSERILAPAGVVQHVGQLEFVDMVNAEGTLERRFVRTGEHYGDKVEILSGLDPGDTVAWPPKDAGVRFRGTRSSEGNPSTFQRGSGFGVQGSEFRNGNLPPLLNPVGPISNGIDAEPRTPICGSVFRLVDQEPL
jgi:RND family efflux transporter MFP subunit